MGVSANFSRSAGWGIGISWMGLEVIQPIFIEWLKSVRSCPNRSAAGDVVGSPMVSIRSFFVMSHIFLFARWGNFLIMLR